MKSEANLNWHICAVKQKVLFRYNKKPSAEKNYNILGKYNRVFYGSKNLGSKSNSRGLLSSILNYNFSNVSTNSQSSTTKPKITQTG